MSQTATLSIPAPNAGWLLSRRFDLFFMIGPILLGLFFSQMAGISIDWLKFFVFADLWLLGYHHVIATFTKLAGTAEDRQNNQFLIYKLPFIVLAGVALIASTIGLWAIVSIYFFWQWYHYVRQSYGIAVFYRRKGQREAALSPIMVTFMLWMVPIWGVLNRCAQNPDSFLGMPIWMPPVPEMVADLFGVAAGLCVLWFAYDRIRALRNGTFSLPYTLYMASHFFIFATGYVLIDDVTLGWLAVNVWHNFQYIVFVWLFNTHRFSKPDAPASIFSIAGKRDLGHVAAYFILTLAATTFLYGITQGSTWLIVKPDAATYFVVMVVLMQTFNFHHYIVDSMIWKARKAENRATLGVS